MSRMLNVRETMSSTFRVEQARAEQRPAGKARQRVATGTNVRHFEQIIPEDLLREYDTRAKHEISNTDAHYGHGAE